MSQSATVRPKGRPVNVVDPIAAAKDGGDAADVEAPVRTDLQSVFEHLDQLVQEKTELRRQLDTQLKINEELKRLLIASVGSDFEARLARLVSEKQGLAADVQHLQDKLAVSIDNYDKVNIQADKWRTKFLACQVLVNDLSEWKAKCMVRFGHLKQTVAAVNTELNDLWMDTARSNALLEALTTTDADKSQSASKGWRTTCVGSGRQARAPRTNDLPGLNEQNLHLAEKLFFNTCGSLPDAVRLPSRFDRRLSPTESLFSQSIAALYDTLHCAAAPADHPPVSRFHASADFDNLTLACCRYCKGHIHVV